MKECFLCKRKVNHLKKHMKAQHPEEFRRKFPKQKDLKVNRSHTCPVVYLQNFARLSPKYLQKDFTIKTYREPDRKDYLIYAHNKIENSPIFQASLESIGVRTKFYSEKVENYLRQIENSVSREFRKIRKMTTATFVNPFMIFRFMMNQLVRTPKFLQKLEKDLNYLKSMSEEDFNKSLMNFLHVQKPNEVTKKDLVKLHEDMILFNTLEKIYKWSTMTVITNHTQIPFIDPSDALFSSLLLMLEALRFTQHLLVEFIVHSNPMH